LAEELRPKPVFTESARTGRPEKADPDLHIATDTAPLFPNNELEDLRNRWNAVQVAFVDEPRHAVEQADGLVASAMKRLAEVFAEELFFEVRSAPVPPSLHVLKASSESLHVERDDAKNNWQQYR
jgi:hypothetical protein